jgi:hypothetical protein
MTNLGSFGVERPALDDTTFDYFGTTIRVHPDLSDLTIVDMFSGLTGDQTDLAKAIGMIRGVAELLVHADDVETFWQLARKNRQTIQDVVEVGTQLLAVITDRPTQLPSDSSAGQPPTAANSEDADFSTALTLLQGRPDLQVAVIQAHDARSA